MDDFKKALNIAINLILLFISFALTVYLGNLDGYIDYPFTIYFLLLLFAVIPPLGWNAINKFVINRYDRDEISVGDKIQIVVSALAIAYFSAVSLITGDIIFLVPWVLIFVGDFVLIALGRR